VTVLGLGEKRQVLKRVQTGVTVLGLGEKRQVLKRVQTGVTVFGLGQKKSETQLESQSLYSDSRVTPRFASGEDVSV
jgi:hypothetical protein